MYVIAALLMGMGAVAVVVLMLIPSTRAARAGDGVWTPRSAAPPEADFLAADVAGPGMRRIGPGRYLVVMSAYNWQFEPSEVRVPVGSEVTFRARSIQDYHGLAIAGTAIILQLGQSESMEATHTFRERGVYPFLCSEYCGGGHAGMMGRVVVE